MAPSNGIADNVQKVSSQLISALPPGFLMLLMINTIFVIGLLWFLDRDRQAQERVLLPVLSSCIQQVPVEALKHLQKGQ